MRKSSKKAGKVDTLRPEYDLSSLSPVAFGKGWKQIHRSKSSADELKADNDRLRSAIVEAIDDLSNDDSDAAYKILHHALSQTSDARSSSR